MMAAVAGEDIQSGQSANARMLIIEMGADDLNWELLTIAQRRGQVSQFAQAIRAYVRWMAARNDDVRALLDTRDTELRALAADYVSHAWTADIIDSVDAGWFLFLDFCQERGHLTAKEREAVWVCCWAALTDTAERQAAHQVVAEPASLSVDLLRSALSAWRVHLRDLNGYEPENPAAWGWVQERRGNNPASEFDWRPRGQQHRILRRRPGIAHS